MIKTYEDIEQFFQRRKKLKIKLGLERMQFLLKKLGNPEKKLFAIHIAGTNGKGSTVQFLQSVLKNNGYKVGVFTSPSFTNLCGHILIDGKEIDEQEFVRVFQQLLPYIQQLDEKSDSPTEFEILTVLAIQYFAEKIDIAILEAGMGGRYDTTNVIDPTISVITNVSTDHIQFLGESMEEIAAHKAGIIKENRPVVVGNVTEKVKNVIIEEAKEKNAAVYFLHEHYFYKNGEQKYTWSFEDEEIHFSVGSHGIYQVENISIMLMVLKLLANDGIDINWNDINSLIESTELVGRFEKIVEKPLIILDSAHNVRGIEMFIQSVERSYHDKKKHLLFAGFKDKALDEMLQRLTSHFDSISVTTFQHERAATLNDMQELAEKHHFQVVEDWKEKIISILNDRSRTDVYFVTGSLHFIAQVRTFILTQTNRDYV